MSRPSLPCRSESRGCRTESRAVGGGSTLLAGSLLLILALMAAGPAPAQWRYDGTPVCTAANKQEYIEMIADGSGGTIMVWKDSRDDSGDVYAQRLDPYGNALWAAGGVPVIIEEGFQGNPRICPDGTGGAVVVWECDRFDTHDLRGQRLDADGDRLWLDFGVTVATGPWRQINARLVPDGSGGAFVCWEDERSGGWDIYAQHLQGSNGQRLWLTDGFGVCDQAGDQYGPWMVSDGDGGIIIAWIDNRPVTPGIYAQRYHTGAVREWTLDGVCCCPVEGYKGHLRAVEDGSGGAILVWQDQRVPDYYLLFAQQVDAAGLGLWGPTGTRVSVNYADQMNAELAPDGAGGVYVTWIDSRGADADIYGQRLNQYGWIQWDGGGNAVSSSPQWEGEPQVCATDGGAVFTWRDHRDGQYDIYAQKLDGGGAAAWTAGGVPLCTETTGDQTRPMLVTDTEAGAIVAWQDERGGSLYTDIYAQRVEEHGYWGYPCGPMVSVQDVPGDQGGWVEVVWAASRLDDMGGPVQEYTVWRQASGSPVWDRVATVPATASTFYAATVPTTADSSTGGVILFSFRTVAHTGDPSVSWESAPLAGYSVDNLAPAEPQDLHGEAQWDPPSLTLSWEPVSDPDLSHYAVYLSDGPGTAKAAGQPLGITDETFFVIEPWLPGPDDFYLVVAVDDSGNESEAASLGISVITPVGEATPAATFLGQNAPNPFNPTTEIRFGLSGPGPVSLQVYDMGGRLVRRLVDGVLAAGTHRVTWDGRDGTGRSLPSGLYLYRLQAGDRRETRRMMLVR